MKYPDKNSYINIHTHRKPMVEDEWVVRNAHPDLTSSELSHLDYKVSLGILPEFIEDEKSAVEAVESLKPLVENPTTIAVGAIGIDRKIKTDIKLQRKIFRLQLELAEQIRKPLIIHSIQAYDDLIPMMKDSSLPWVFHQFRGDLKQAKDIIENNGWLSFGKCVAQPISPLHNVIRELPTERLLLETGNYNLINIHQAYHHMSLLVNLQVEDLQETIYKSFMQIFGSQLVQQMANEKDPVEE